jgi:TPR repeat protein
VIPVFELDEPMSDTSDIDLLLQAPASLAVAEQLLAWAEKTRQQIARGDLQLGILSIESLAQIPVAYKTAAQQGLSPAWVTLAWWYAFPDIGEPDLPAAEDAIQEALAADFQDAKLELARLRWFCKRETASLLEQQQAFEYVSEITTDETENAEAFYLLALLTTHGFGVDASPAAGFRLQQRAVELGNVDAQFEIYVHYANGLGVAVDEERAFAACQRAAEGGHPRAMYNLGAFNATGRGTPRNMTEAVKWYERAADVGNAAALAGLAMIYATGDGVELDHEYARELFDQADYCGLDVSQLREQVGL